MRNSLDLNNRRDRLQRQVSKMLDQRISIVFGSELGLVEMRAKDAALGVRFEDLQAERNKEMAVLLQPELI